MTATSWYRRSVWNYKGTREYTKAGYDLASPKFVAEDLDVDCTDRHYMITGCNSGIGLEIAMEVAKRGGVLHMVCRNKDAAKAARSDIITTTGNDKIYLHVVDLSHPVELAYWAQKFAAQHEKLHVLVNNAGVLHRDKRVDDYGIEGNFSVNVLAPYILNVTLLPILQKNEDARVITVSSAGMLTVRLDPLDLMHEAMEPYDGRLVYSQNKRQQVVMTLWFAQRYENVHFSSMHPGWADTAAVRDSIPEFYEVMKESLRSPAEGADTAVWLALSKAALTHPSGLFFQDREPVPTHLPLAWTKTTIEEEDLLMKKIEEIRSEIASHLPQPKVEEEEKVEALVQEEAEKKEETTKVVEKDIPAVESIKAEASPAIKPKEEEKEEQIEEQLEEEKLPAKPTEPEELEIPAEPVEPEEPELPAEPEDEPELPAKPEPEAELIAESIAPKKSELPAEPIEPEIPTETIQLPQRKKKFQPIMPIKPEPVAEPIAPPKPIIPAEPIAPTKPIIPDEPIAPPKPKMAAAPTGSISMAKPKMSSAIDTTKPIDLEDEVVVAKVKFTAELISPGKPKKVEAPAPKPTMPSEPYTTSVKPRMEEVVTTHVPTSSIAHKLEKPKTNIHMEE